MKPIIAPSILAADFLQLGAGIDMINQSEAEWIHIDVMDGAFVPNISFGFPILDAVNKATDKYLDVHLMIADADKYLADFKKFGADSITVHYEASPHLHRTIQHIKELGMNAGVALNPATPVEVLSEIAADLDLVLIMSVNPGFGGQKFIDATLNKVARTEELLHLCNSEAIIQVDGGVGPNNAQAVVEAGADVLVSGSAVFNAEDPIAAIAAMHNIQA